MKTRRILFVAAMLAASILPAPSTTAGDLPSKDHPSPEPFSDLQPFELPKQPAKPIAKTKAALPPHNASADSDETKRNHARLEKILRVNDLGDPERLLFEGNSKFPERQLRWALACDLKYQAAARPSNDIGDFISTLQNRLIEGYEFSGCPHAVAHARRDEKNNIIVVHIDEGVRYRKGAIRVRRSKAVSESALNEWLTKPQPLHGWQYVFTEEQADGTQKTPPHRNTAWSDRATVLDDDGEPTIYWKLGEAIDFREPDKLKTKGPNLTEGIRCALADLGHGNSRFDLDLERDDKNGIIIPSITILEAAPRVVVGQIEATGLKRDSKTDLFEYLKVRPGDPINRETLRELDRQLSESCRYWTYTIEIELPPSSRYKTKIADSKATLRLLLEECAAAPKLNEPLPAESEVV
jgi:hypothetical protein